MLKKLIWWLRGRWDRDRAAWNVDEDIRTHLELDAERLRADGHSPAEAMRMARERFGDPERVRREMLEIAAGPLSGSTGVTPARVGVHMMHGARSLFRSPGPSVLVAATLAAAVAANTTVFAVARSVLLGDAGVDDADRVASIHTYYEALPDGLREQPVHPTEFERLESLDALAEAAAFKAGYFNLTGHGAPRRIDGMLTTPRLFEVAGTRPMMGPGFTRDAGEDLHQVVVSWHFWNEILGGDPSALGSSIVLNEAPYEVVGVMPPDFRFPRGDDVPATFRFPSHPDLWTPYDLPQGGPSDLGMVGRLEPTASLSTLREQLASAARTLAEERGPGGMAQEFRAMDMRDQAVGAVRPALRILVLATLLLFVVAVGNVTGVGVARAEARARELGVRIALGAGRGGAIAFLASEGLVLGMVSGAVGLAAAMGITALLRRLALPGIAGLDEVHLSGPVVGSAVVLSLVGGFTLALGPMLRVAKWRTGEVLRGGRIAGSVRARRVGQMIVTLELATTLVLICAGVVLTRSLVAMLAIDPGFDGRGVLTAEVTLPESSYPDRVRARAVQRAQKRTEAAPVPRFQQELVARLRERPGVVDAAFAHPLPFAGTQEASVFWIDGMDPPESSPLAEYTVVSEHYFATMGIPILEGREFTAAERFDSEPVAVVSESLAALFPGRRAVGGLLKLGGRPDAPYPWLRVVGVVPDVRRTELTKPARPEMYVHVSQGGYTSMETTRLVVRVPDGAAPASAAATVRSVLGEMDPDVPLESVASMEELLADAMARSRFTAQLMAAFAALALFITALGLYSAVSYAVTTRSRELAVRKAIGASESRVLREVLTETAVSVALGLSLGIVGVLATARLLETVVFGVTPTEPASLSGAVGLVCATTVIAALGPARRCLSQDPVRVLSAE